MEPILWIDSTDLKNWAKRRECHGYLPLLMRRLIRATAKNISHIFFPAGDSVSSPGWDGFLEVSEGTEFIPEGVSVWEMGCNRDVKVKADNDYEKRKENISGINPSETTYIFVSPRAWTKNKKWCEEKKADGFWKDVKAYNAATLEEWIEQAPAVGIWLGQLIGKYPEGVKALVDWWDEWNKSTSPPLTTELVLAGRDKQVKKLHKELESSSSQITVQSATIDESIAFLAAVINSLPEEEREYYLSRSIVINDSEAFEHVSITIRSELLLVPEFKEIKGFALATQKGHGVYIPVGSDNTVANPNIVLPRLGRDAFISALEEMGLSNENSQKYARNTGRSLTVLRRQLMGYTNQPEWAKSDSASDIIPALLVGCWVESNNADKEIIGKIAGESYKTYSQKLYSWRNQQDSPILKIGEFWRLVSAMDAFFALAPFITQINLEHFKDIVLTVFRSLDPALELEPEERWMATVHGKVPLYSNHIRNGIIQVLILIGVFGDDAKVSLSTSAQTWVDSIIRELLQDAECNLWMSLDDVLPLIAEASPKSFMDAVDFSLYGDEKPIMCLFEETQGIMGPSANHSSLIWALEHLSWSPELLPRVALILGKLAKYDPDSESRVINRPKNSLRDIFLLWNFQTYASFEKRLEVLDLLIDKYPEVGWNLLVDLMPKDHDTVYVKSQTIWRQFSETPKPEVTMAEYYANTIEIINRLLSYVGSNGQRWVNVMDNFASLPVDERNRIIEKLSSDVDRILVGRYELWNKLREIISRHRSYPDSDWSLPEEELQYLEGIYLSLEPDDAIDRVCWLFDGLPDLLEGVRIEDHHENDEHFIQLRIGALNVIKDEHGFEGLIKLAKRIKNSQYIGTALAEDDLDSIEEEKLYSLLEDEDETKMIFVKAYIFHKSFSDEEWISNLVQKVKTENWQDKKIINCFTAFPSRMFVWDLLNSFDKNIQESYWKKCGFGGIRGATEDKIYYLKQIVQVKRYYTALYIASLYAEEIPPALIAKILEKAAIDKSEEEVRIDQYRVERLFEELYKSEYPESEIAKLEWYYLSFLAGVDRERQSPRLLHNELSSNPEFFVEIMKYIYKRKDDKKDDNKEKLSEELLKQRATLSWRLFRSWKKIPGTSDNNEIDYVALNSWIERSRELCKEADRIKVCDIQIGKLLANVEPENDVWPPESMSKIIESVKSEDLHRGFIIGTKNKRGSYTKAIDEGGKQELALAEKFRKYANNLNTRFPKTASLLGEIAESYENQAKKEDDEAEIRDLDD
ncbi:MAG: hypothetical protein CIT01_07155 [Methanobacterium sp. BRmetb2]|nr:MAG: hypothetical protein CIT01_07155 [Methanobacterium sp. BRmetb2]